MRNCRLRPLYLSIVLRIGSEADRKLLLEILSHSCSHEPMLARTRSLRISQFEALALDAVFDALLLAFTAQCARTA